MNFYQEPAIQGGLVEITDDTELEQISGGIPLLLGWAIAATVGTAIGVGAAYVVQKYC